MKAACAAVPRPWTLDVRLRLWKQSPASTVASSFFFYILLIYRHPNQRKHLPDTCTFDNHRSYAPALPRVYVGRREMKHSLPRRYGRAVHSEHTLPDYPSTYFVTKHLAVDVRRSVFHAVAIHTRSPKPPRQTGGAKRGQPYKRNTNTHRGPLSTLAVRLRRKQKRHTDAEIRSALKKRKPPPLLHPLKGGR